MRTYNTTGSANSIVDGSSYCLLLNNDEVCSNTTKLWSSYDQKSQWLLSQECRYWYRLPLHEERDTFLPCGGVSRRSVSHSGASKPVLQASTLKKKSDHFFTISPFTMSTRFNSWLSVMHTKPVKAPAYTCALPDIGNGECIKMVIEHEPHMGALTSIEKNS